MATRNSDFGFGQNEPESSYSQNPGSSHFPPGIPNISPFGYMASNDMALFFGKGNPAWPAIGGNAPFVAGQWTETKTGTGAATAQATNGGLLQTCGSTSTFNTNNQSVGLWTPVPNKRISALARLKTSDITTVGFEFSCGTSAVDPDTTNYTSVVGLKMKAGDGAIVGKVRGTSGTQALSGIPRASSTSTTVTTGASSATQTVGSTAGMTVGDVLYFAVTKAYRTVKTISSGISVILDATISTTTAEAVTVAAPFMLAVAATDFFIGFQFNLGVAKYEGTRALGTGASSTTQAFVSTAGIAPGDVLYFATTNAYRTVISITSATALVVDTTISTTTGEAVTVYSVDGGFYAGTAHDSFTYYPFTFDQRVQAGKILTTPASMYLNCSAKGSAGNPTVTWGAVLPQVDY